MCVCVCVCVHVWVCACVCVCVCVCGMGPRLKESGMAAPYIAFLLLTFACTILSFQLAVSPSASLS